MRWRLLCKLISINNKISKFGFGNCISNRHFFTNNLFKYYTNHCLNQTSNRSEINLTRRIANPLFVFFNFNVYFIYLNIIYILLINFIFRVVN